MKVSQYMICKPLKPVSDFYWIGIETGPAEISVIAKIKLTKLGKEKFGEQFIEIMKDLQSKI